MMTSVTQLLQHLLLWRLWRAFGRKLPNHPIYNYRRGDWLYHESHVLEPGAAWTFLITRTLGEEFGSASFTLLAVTPTGRFGAVWLVASGVMHRRFDFVQVVTLIFMLTRFLSVLYSPALMSFLLTDFATEINYWQPFILLVNALLVFVTLLLFWAVTLAFDICLGGMLGMLLPTFEGDKTSLAVFGVTFHLFVLVTSVSVANAPLLLYLWLPPTSFVWLGTSVVHIAFMVTVVEWVTRVLWAWVLRRYQATPEDAARALAGEL